MPDVLSTLTPPSWRGIPFPISTLENGFTHQHVEHEFIYVAGAHIETTGRKALSFLARIPFHNNIRAGDFEPWAGQVLFPTLFRRFLNACLDGSTGEFLHPDFGPLQCKARDVNWRYLSTVRDGAEISVRWYQTNDLDDGSELVANESPNAAATKSATALDSALAATGPLPELGNDKGTFSSLVSDYQNGNGNIGRVESKLSSTEAALDRRDSVADWPLRQATENLRSTLISLGGSPGQPLGSPGSNRVREYTVPFSTSLASIGIRVGVRTDRLVTMNPSLARDPTVRAGTVVRFQL